MTPVVNQSSALARAVSPAGGKGARDARDAASAFGDALGGVRQRTDRHEGTAQAKIKPAAQQGRTKDDPAMSASATAKAGDPRTSDDVDPSEPADLLGETQEAVESDGADGGETASEEIRLPIQMKAEQTISVLMAMAPIAARPATPAAAGQHGARGETEAGHGKAISATSGELAAAAEGAMIPRQSDEGTQETPRLTSDTPPRTATGTPQAEAVRPAVDAEHRTRADHTGKAARSGGEQPDGGPEAPRATGTTEARDTSSAGADAGGDQPASGQSDQQGRAPEARDSDAQPVAAKVSVIAQHAAPAPPSPTLGASATAVVTAIAADQSWRLAGGTSTEALQSFRDAQPMRSLKIELHPAELGTVTANLKAAGEQLSVELQVESLEAYDRLSADSDQIVSSLRSLGYDIDQVTIQQPQAAGTIVARADASAGSGSFARDGSSFQPGNPGNGGERSGGQTGGREDRSNGQGNEQTAQSRRDRAGGDIYI